MNKKQLEKIDKVVNRACTVADLIAHLQTLPANARVGVAGHFGEFIPMDVNDFYYSAQRATYAVADDDWRCEHRLPLNFVEVEAPDRGEEPS